MLPFLQPLDTEEGVREKSEKLGRGKHPVPFLSEIETKASLARLQLLIGEWDMEKL